MPVLRLLRTPLRALASTFLATAAVLAVTAAPSFAAASPGPPDPGAPTPIERIAGTDRYETAAALSAAHYRGRVDVVHVASGASYADALAAAPAAVALEGPILLTAADQLPRATADELARLRPHRVVIIGGPAAVSLGVEAAVARAADAEVTRLAGADRYETANALVTATFATAPKVFLASGAAFQEALAAAGAAGADRAPLLLTEPGELPASTLSNLRRLGPSEVVVVGDRTTVSDAVAQQVAAETKAVVRRVGSTDRFRTVASLFAQQAISAERVIVASGESFPDALSAAVLSGRDRLPLLLARQACVPPTAGLLLDRWRPAQVLIMGGTGALGPEVEQRLRCETGPFRFMAASGDRPARWDPCRPIHYAVNPGTAPDWMLDELDESLARLSAVTDYRFVRLPDTGHVPTSSGHPTPRPQDADLVVAWTDGATADEVSEAGRYGWGGFGFYRSDSGELRIASSHVLVHTERAGEKLTQGFGPRSHGSLLLHELGHAFGLDHVEDTAQLMHPSLDGGAAGAYAQGDLEGFAVLTMDGCFDG